MAPKAFLPDQLTRRQVECLRQVKNGLTAKQIAHLFGISHRTVEAHIAAAIETLQVNNRVAAVTRLDELENGQADTPAAATGGLALGLRAVDPDIGSYVIQPREAEKSPDREYQAPIILPPLGGDENTASYRKRIVWFFRIAMASIMLTSLVILAVSVLLELAGTLG